MDPVQIEFTQVAGNFVAALAGGGVAAYASWLAIGRQMRLQKENLARSALEFFEFLFSEETKILQKIVNEKATQNTILFIDLDRLNVTYQLFERNRESLIHVPKRDVRERIVDLISEIQTWQIICRSALSSRYEAERKREKEDANSEAASNASEDIARHTHNINNWFPDVMGYLNRAAAITQELREKAK